MATQSQLSAIDAINGGTASAPLTAEQQDIRSLSQTQAIPAQTISEKPSPASSTVPVFTQEQLNTSTVTTGTAGDSTAKANQQIGVGAASDDKGSSTTVPVAVNAQGGSSVTPSPNVLDQYANYTYALSWYLLTPEQFTTMKETSKLNTNGWSLLMQSGGAPVKERNKYFMLDYYMDNLEIETSFLNNMVASATSLNFTVTEPNGITLIGNINKAVRDLYKQPAGSVQNAFYVMVIRFYGWDAQGNLVTKVSPVAGTPGTTPGVSNSVVVKYYPFQITKLTFKAANKAIEYRIEGNMPQYTYATGSALGSVPHNVELSGETVDDVLNGKITDVKAGDDSKRTTTTSPTKAKV